VREIALGGDPTGVAEEAPAVPLGKRSHLRKSTAERNQAIKRSWRFGSFSSSPPQDLVSFGIKLEMTVGKRMKENHSAVCYRKQRKNLY